MAVGVVKRFAGVPALDGVSVAVRPGAVTGLVGHNGAGKSTLLRTLAGALIADEGNVRIDGADLGRGGPAAALAAGISTVYQELSLLANLTVTQNVFLGRERRRRGTLDREGMRRSARQLVDRFDINVDVDRTVSEYPIATRQLLEIAVAISRNARYLLLDEPTTSLEGPQIARLLELIRSLAVEDGLGVLLVNHKLDELYAVADTVVALVNGQVRIEGAARDVPRDDVIRAIAGNDATATPHAGGRAPVSDDVSRDLATELALRVRDLCGGVFRSVTVDAYAGRVLGIYGLVGSGRTEFLRALVGLEAIESGEVELFGGRFRPRSPSRSQRAGVVYLTEDRKIDGLVGGLDATTNVVLPILRQFTRFGVLDRRAVVRLAGERMDELRLRGDRHAPVERLSGGNQQKVLLARALAQGPRLLLLDEPTKGVDIGVKSEIHRLLRSLAHDQRIAVVVVSSEEEEILDVADDVATFILGTCDGSTQPASSLTPARLRHAAWEAA